MELAGDAKPLLRDPTLGLLLALGSDISPLADDGKSESERRQDRERPEEQALRRNPFRRQGTDRGVTQDDGGAEPNGA